MSKWRKKPVVIDAFLWTGDMNQTEDPEWMQAPMKQGESEIGGIWFVDGNMMIMTLEGIMKAEVGDWIIKGIENEIYPCKPGIFKATYEQV